MSNLEQQCNNLLAQAQTMLLRDRWSNAYSAFVEAFTLADAHYREAPLYRKIGTAVCYRVFKAYLYGAMGLVKLREGAFQEAIEQFTKGVALCPHDSLLQRAVLANLQLGFISEAHRYLRMLHHPPITNDNLIFSLSYEIHVPSSEIYSLEALLYMHLRDIDRAISSCLTGMSILAEEVRTSSLGAAHHSLSNLSAENPRAHTIKNNDSPQQTAFQKRLCMHCLSLCETMRMAAEMGLGVPYLVSGSLELVLESLFPTLPNGVVEGNRILDFSLLSNLAFMTLLDNDGDPTLPGRGVTLPEMLVTIFSMSFKCTSDVLAIPLKITPFLSLNVFTDTIQTELASYSEAYRKAIIDHGVALLDRRYLIIQPAALSKYVEKTYGLVHSSVTPVTNGQEHASSRGIQNSTHSISSRRIVSTGVERCPTMAPAPKIVAKVAANTKYRRVIHVPVTRDPLKTTTKHRGISSENHIGSKPLQSTKSTTYSSKHNKQTIGRKGTSIRQVMDRFEGGLADLDSHAVLPIVTRSTKEHREELSFLPHSDAKIASNIKEIDNATQVTLEKISTMDGAMQISPKVYNLYTNNISTCHECSYSTPTFATRRLRDEEDREGVINLHNQVRATNAFRDISLGGMYKSQLEKSMTGTLRERMFIELTLEKLEKDGLEDFSFLKTENLHLINRTILFDGSIAASNPVTSKRRMDASTVKDSLTSSLLHSSHEPPPQSEKDTYQASHNRTTLSTVSTHSQRERLHTKAVTESTLQNNELASAGSYTDEPSSAELFTQCPSITNCSVTESNYVTAPEATQAQVSVLDRKQVPFRSISKNHIKKLVAKSSKKASISRNAAYQQLKEENRLGIVADDIENRSSDDLDAEELIKKRSKLYMLTNSSSTSPSPELILAANELSNRDCLQIVTTPIVHSETAALAESILSKKAMLIESLQPNNLLDNAPEVLMAPRGEDAIGTDGNITTLLRPVSYSSSEDDFLLPLPQQTHPPIDTQLPLRCANNNVCGHRAGVGRPAMSVAVPQPPESFGYLIDTLHIRDISEPTVPDPCMATSTGASTLISTTRLPYSDNLLLKVELDQSTREFNLATVKDSDDASLPTYKGIMHVSVRLGTASKASSGHLSKAILATSKNATSYNLALVDDECLTIEEKHQSPDHLGTTRTLDGESSDVTNSPLSAHSSSANNATAKGLTLPSNSTGVTVTCSKGNIDNMEYNTEYDTLSSTTKRFSVPLSSLRTNIFSDISDTLGQSDRGTNEITSSIPVSKTFTTTTHNMAHHPDIMPTSVYLEHKTQSVPKMARAKRRTVPLDAVLNKNTTDIIGVSIKRVGPFSISSMRPSEIQRSSGGYNTALRKETSLTCL
ncbi:hypothetical protein GL50803_006010 [Giardia duodenalis]|uniref:Uncharacterized protein n=1 Tax=Giardia intestinalis (strain ATCC 50803 / WB clone C6) TaxID=184922 RepID=A8BNN5_GIAIC|nr:hypothetical protein GL50803_006010 [Giardia intestinalis]KAE8302493.1 hypothetical protein GL50803_006010 [Giardia intestinalis]|eukprot:XP_001705953.1 Hypothetical protein GL50803_6010 [Giardia lamblia ATCC 50803]